jgi:hypothetical protein
MNPYQQQGYVAPNQAQQQQGGYIAQPGMQAQQPQVVIGQTVGGQVTVNGAAVPVVQQRHGPPTPKEVAAKVKSDVKKLLPSNPLKPNHVTVATGNPRNDRNEVRSIPTRNLVQSSGHSCWQCANIIPSAPVESS